jgi:hypothetical protein
VWIGMAFACSTPDAVGEVGSGTETEASGDTGTTSPTCVGVVPEILEV